MSEVVQPPVVDALGRRRVLAALKDDTACGVARGNCRGVAVGCCQNKAKSDPSLLLPLPSQVPDAGCRLTAGIPILRSSKDKVVRAIWTVRSCRLEEGKGRARLNVQTQSALFQMASTKRDLKEHQYCFENEHHPWWNALRCPD